MIKKVTEKKIYEQELESDSENDIEQEVQEEDKPKEKKFIYNEKEMNEKYMELQSEVHKKIGKKKLDFHDLMSIVSPNAVELTTTELNDDIQREVVLYNIALENTKKALENLEKEGIKTQRPDDFLAEMFKKDIVMQKIKNRLVKQQVKIQNFEEKQHRIENKKFSKHLKAKKELEKHREKKQNLEAINEWKDEIKTKGEKAKDLSEFVLKRKDKNPEKSFGKKQNFEGKSNPEKSFGKKQNFEGKSKGEKFSKMSQFSKKVSKTKGNQRLSRKKMPKQKRPGKVTRMMMKNKKSSGKSRK